MPFRIDPSVQVAIGDALVSTGEQTLPAEAYWERLRPVLSGFGITRIADITGLDRVGFPVVQAVRPRACSNAVTQGKATTLAGAAVGACLECLEMAAGENVARLAAAQGDAEPWRHLALDAEWPAADTAYVAGWDLATNTAAAVPRDLISTDFSRGAEAERAPILRHSIGLGAGTTLGAALLHGLHEAIEADARLRAEAGGTMTRVDVEAGTEAAGLTQRLEAKGLRVAFWQMPAAGGLCAIKASLMEAPGATTLPLPATGFAARPDPAAAAMAALAEAVQARLAVISGAREDITQRFYDLTLDIDDIDALWNMHAAAPARQLSGAHLKPQTLQRLAASVGTVLAVVLHWDPQVPLAITRVVSPSLVADPLVLETQR